jgi:hypothetical protein
MIMGGNDEAHTEYFDGEPYDFIYFSSFYGHAEMGFFDYFYALRSY